MNRDKPLNDELNNFLNAKPAEEAPTSAPPSIVKDLVVSKPRLAAIYAVASIVGYFFTLAVCAQCSVGLSPLAWKTASLFHAIPDPWCAIVCGAVFGVAPFIVSSSVLTRFQHRYLLFRMTWVPVLVPIVGSLLMTAAGSEHDWAWQSSWILSAIFTPYLLEAAAGARLKQQLWQPRVQS